MKYLLTSWAALALLFSASLVPTYPSETSRLVGIPGPSLGRVSKSNQPRVLVSAFAAEADDKKADPPVVVLPDVTPTPAPPPKPDPALPTVLAADVIYLIRANVNCTVVEGVEGLVKITALKGPVTFAHTRFTDGTGYETRTVTEPYIYFVEAAGKGLVDIIVIPDGGKPIRRKLDVGGVGPGPKPPDPPDPGPNPDPFMSSEGTPPGFRVLIVYDYKALPSTGKAYFDSAAVREYLRAKCIVEGKQYSFRMFEQSMSDLTNESAVWQKVMALPRKSLPWIVIGNGKTGFSGPLPGTLDDTMKLLKKYGGE